VVNEPLYLDMYDLYGDGLKHIYKFCINHLFFVNNDKYVCVKLVL